MLTMMTRIRANVLLTQETSSAKMVNPGSGKKTQENFINCYRKFAVQVLYEAVFEVYNKTDEQIVYE